MVLQVYLPLLLYHKKHYSGIKFESSTDPGKRDIKGLACVRKDICPFMRRTMLEAIDHLLGFDNAAAIRCIQAAAEQMLSGMVPLDDLVMSKQLGAEYASDSHPHVRVARLMEERNPGSEPKVGDRVSYVWVEVGDKGTKGFERAEDPGFVRAHPDAARPDYLQYFQKQLATPLRELVANVTGDRDPFDTPAITERQKLLTVAREQRDRDCKRAAARQHAITAFYGRRIKSD